MSGFVWLAFVVGMILYSQAQAKKMKEKQRAKTAFEQLEKLAEESARKAHAGKITKKGEVRPANQKAETSLRTPLTKEETKRQIARKKQELKRKREQQPARHTASPPNAGAQTNISDNATTPVSGSEIRSEFDLRKAVIYSEILKPRYEAYEQ